MKTTTSNGTSFAPLAGLTLADARAELANLKRERSILDARILAVVAHIDSLATADRPEYAIPERELMAHAGMSGREAREAVARSLVTESAPQFAEALAKGDTTAAHIDAIGRGLKIAGADREAFLAHIPHLAEAATTLTVGEFNTLVKETAKSVQSDGGLATLERQQRETYLKTWTDHDGMVQVRGQFDPINGAAFSSLLEQQKERMFHSGDRDVPVVVAPGIEPNEHRRAHALLALVNHAPVADGDVRANRAEIVVHIDLATQYCSWVFGQRLRQAGLMGSMGTVGDALDNAVAESFFASLQCELLDRHRWDTRAELARTMFHYVEVFYNPQRRHSTLGYLSPVDYETINAA